MPASAPGKPGSFLLEVGLGLDVGRAGKAWAAALCVLSPVSLLWGVWSPGPSLPHPPQTPGLAPLRVCASVFGQVPAWRLCLGGHYPSR